MQARLAAAPSQAAFDAARSDLAAAQARARALEAAVAQHEAAPPASVADAAATPSQAAAAPSEAQVRLVWLAIDSSAAQYRRPLAPQTDMRTHSRLWEAVQRSLVEGQHVCERKKLTTAFRAATRNLQAALHAISETQAPPSAAAPDAPPDGRTPGSAASSAAALLAGPLAGERELAVHVAALRTALSAASADLPALAAEASLVRSALTQLQSALTRAVRAVAATPADASATKLVQVCDVVAALADMAAGSAQLPGGGSAGSAPQLRSTLQALAQGADALAALQLQLRGLTAANAALQRQAEERLSPRAALLPVTQHEARKAANAPHSSRQRPLSPHSEASAARATALEKVRSAYRVELHRSQLARTPT